MITCDFLVEIGTDELPPKILKQLGIDFSIYIGNVFQYNNIHCKIIQWFAAPRHLAVTAKISVMKKDILVKSDYQDCHCFYKPNHISNYTINNTDNCESIVNNNHNQIYQNNSLIKNCLYSEHFKLLLLKIVNDALAKLIHYKMMRWGEVKTPFIRPVNTVIILLNSCLITGRLFDIDINRISYGHRYIKNNKIVIKHAKDYPDLLKTKGHIIVDYDMRKKTIQIAIQKQASKLGGVIDLKNDSFLIEEITALTEWPVILFGKFNKRFLSLPSEVILHIMREHQRYFPVYNVTNGILLPYFIFVVNTITQNYQQIIAGHENVLKTRFKDSEFFLKNDSQYRLEDYIPKLNSILFHRQLGSLHDKVCRIATLSGWMAAQLGMDITQTKRASYLCKCDLMTNMVLEFPKLQGVIGMYYARRDQESEIVSIALKEHYQPKYITDPIPIQLISCIISIADKIDTISGIIGIKEIPTSSRDPFALKRAASGIINIIIQKKLLIDLTQLIYKSVELHKFNLNQFDIIINTIQNFINKCLFSFYCSQGYRSDIVNSIFNMNYNNIIDCSSRIHATHNFCIFKKKEYLQLYLLYKRIVNILKKQNLSYSNTKIHSSLFKKSEEKVLFIQIMDLNKRIKLLFTSQLYDTALLAISDISGAIIDFLNNVTVLDKNQDIRINRLLLLKSTKLLILKVIDFSIIHPQKLN